MKEAAINPVLAGHEARALCSPVEWRSGILIDEPRKRLPAARVMAGTTV